MAGHTAAWTDYMSWPTVHLDVAMSLITVHVTMRAGGCASSRAGRSDTVPRVRPRFQLEPKHRGKQLSSHHDKSRVARWKGSGGFAVQRILTLSILFLKEF